MSEAAGPRRVHFRGLNGLRFFAAMFVVIGHIPMNQYAVGLPNWHWGAMFYRGRPAVNFFFVLSGFLITYLLLEERRRNGAIDVGRFYLRRIFRIWPLYFLVVAVGLIFYNGILPQLGISYVVEYSLGTAIPLYALMLPNLMNAVYSVGGILNPLWSIGVEEQFYLTWAPLVKRTRQLLPALCGLILMASFTLGYAGHVGLLGRGWQHRLIEQLAFHFMAAGGLAAWALQRHRERFLKLPPFTSRLTRALLLAVLLEYYFVGRLPWGWVGTELVQVVSYSWLIVDVAANQRWSYLLEKRWVDHFGVVSYGIYMYHMIVVYAVSGLFKYTRLLLDRPPLYLAAYYACAIGGTLLLSHLSYRHFESWFLRYKDRRLASVSAVVGSDSRSD